MRCGSACIKVEKIDSASSKSDAVSLLTAYSGYADLLSGTTATLVGSSEIDSQGILSLVPSIPDGLAPWTGITPGSRKDGKRVS